MVDSNMTVSNENFTAVLATLKETFETGITSPVAFRKQQLKNMLNMLVVHEQDLVHALKKDLGKSRMEAVCMEVEFCRNNIRSAIADVENWVLDEHVEKNLVTLLDTTFIRREPFGVVLIMGAWNYPVQLCILPAIGAIAAGNCVIIKTSELAPATAKVMELIFPQFLNDKCYKIVSGGVPEATGMIH
jgi:acyl-CoA reductase-like NAD-dependent aldehyde dehydrogenase